MHVAVPGGRRARDVVGRQDCLRDIGLSSAKFSLCSNGCLGSFGALKSVVSSRVHRCALLGAGNAVVGRGSGADAGECDSNPRSSLCAKSEPMNDGNLRETLPECNVEPIDLVH